MRLAARLRPLALPVVALALVAAMLAIQIAHGGGRFAPTALADPCGPPAAPTRPPTTLDGLGQDLVLLGLDAAACRLGTSREALTLDLAETRASPMNAEVDALRAGLLDAVDRMQRDGTLPPAADLVDQALDASNVNGLAKLAIRALPGDLVDTAVPTDQVLRQAVDNLDVRALLTSLDDTDQLTTLVTRAVTTAVEQTLTARLRSLL